MFRHIPAQSSREPKATALAGRSVGLLGKAALGSWRRSRPLAEWAELSRGDQLRENRRKSLGREPEMGEE